MRQDGEERDGYFFPVSIHASVKDATKYLCANVPLFSVSIHASVKDATLRNNHYWRIVCFNPRICKRCDFLTIPRLSVLQVSIHASVKDATLFSFAYHPTPLCFNPRICKRCDSVCSQNRRGTHGFNPRICKRCD